MVDRWTRSYLVECYWPGISSEKVAETEEHLRARVATLRVEGRDVAFLGSILVPVDESLFFLFDGEEADVQMVTTLAGVPFGRVLASLRSGPAVSSATGL